MNPQLAFDVQLSVIVPAYNEEDRIAYGISQIIEFLQSKQKHSNNPGIALNYFIYC